MATKSNLVHTYVEGNSFPSIFGGHTPSQFGSITHIEYMSPMMEYKWPWMDGMWHLSNGSATVSEWYKTLREAREAATKRWPNCTFKTRKQCAKECDLAGIGLGDW
jgi:hypothetical protein